MTPKAPGWLSAQPIGPGFQMSNSRNSTKAATMPGQSASISAPMAAAPTLDLPDVEGTTFYRLDAPPTLGSFTERGVTWTTQTIELAADGSFSTSQVVFDTGQVALVFRARDAAGNSSTARRWVYVDES